MLGGEEKAIALARLEGKERRRKTHFNGWTWLYNVCPHCDTHFVSRHHTDLVNEHFRQPAHAKPIRCNCPNPDCKPKFVGTRGNNKKNPDRPTNIRLHSSTDDNVLMETTNVMQSAKLQNVAEAMNIHRGTTGNWSQGAVWRCWWDEVGYQGEGLPMPRKRWLKRVGGAN